LFVPHDLPERVHTLAICEGPSDTAAALSLGLAAVGRPSCLSCVEHCVRLVRQREVKSAVVVADADAPGIAGARRLAIALRPYAPDVRVVVPPAKDLREWVRGGATQGELITLIEQAERVSLKTRSHEWSQT
jgi:DNA primase